MIGKALDRENPTVRVLTTLDEARQVGSAGPRLRALRDAAERLRGELLAGGTAVSVRTLPLMPIVYPSRYAFWGTAMSPAPYIVFHHRCLLVQLRTSEGVKTLLFNPTDVRGAGQAPFYARLVQSLPKWAVEQLLARTSTSVTAHLAALAIKPEQIDYVSFDHLHVQDLRSLLGTTGPDARPPLFPHAKLLVQRAEWQEALDTHPIQANWYVPGGLDRVRTDRVVFLDGDVSLGEGVSLVSTPGHTAGNHSLVLRTDRGLWVVSENGVAPECYSPLESRIPGIRTAARKLRLEVILNANTVEAGTEQYTSMIVERTLADPAKDAPGFFQVFPSSELVASPLAPGLAPTFAHREITFGSLHRAATRERARTGATVLH